MSRKSDSPFEGNLLDRVGRRTTNLNINDVALVVGEVLKDERRAIIKHVGRMLRLQEVKAAPAQRDERLTNLHRRLVQVESELRLLKKGGSR